MRPPGIAKTPQDKVYEILDLTLAGKPADATHWSCRRMAAAVGVSKDVVCRIWREHGLKPHLRKGFKVSNDPQFKEKLRDVVGPYVDPPDQAVVATTLLDRLLHHAIVIQIEGSSYRLREHNDLIPQHARTNAQIMPPPLPRRRGRPPKQ